MRQILIRVALCSGALMLLAGLKSASAQPLNSASYSIARTLGGASGSTITFTSYSLNNGLGETGIHRSTTASYNLYVGLMSIISIPGPTSALASTAVSSTTMLLSWPAAGYDGTLGTLPSGSTYYVQYSSANSIVWDQASAQILISTSGSSPNATQTASVAGLLANTTYLFTLWTADPAGDISVLSNQTTAATLTVLPSTPGSPYLFVSFSSASVSWTALPAAPPAASSKTAEGYELDASTAADFSGALAVSSITYNVRSSTLSLAGLELSNTYYVRLGSLNWIRRANYVNLAALNMHIQTSTTGISFGTLDAKVDFSTVSVSSVIVTNTGSLPLTFSVWTTTTTGAWAIATSSGMETVVLRGVWNSSQPPPSLFSTAILPSTTTSSPSNYFGDQSGQAVPVGATRTMWFQFWRPVSSTQANRKQNFQVFIAPQYP